MVKNKVYYKVKYFSILFTVICLIFFNISCGLDTFYYIPSPIQNGYKPEIDNTEVDKQFFQFSTRESSNTGGFKHMGTDVYYKIYTNKDTLKSEKDELVRLSETGSASAADKLTGTSGYGYYYQPLGIEGSSDNVLIPFTGNSRNIKIRLTDYSNIDAFKASVKINDNHYGTPVRYNGKSFNLGGNKGKNIPELNDADVKGSSIPSDGKWYVCLFSVAKGHDAAYTNYYSNITYLGTVSIDSNKMDN